MAGVEQGAGLITVEVAYARPDRQLVLETRVPRGTTVLEAVRLSGILDRFAELDAGHLSPGIFGEAVTVDRVLEPGDRVEIYRELKVDPRDARRRRVLDARQRRGHS
ncbi:MAG: RnfH family protein [Gammaproteobacteria bacterium]